jgi:hypothetical protein
MGDLPSLEILLQSQTDLGLRESHQGPCMALQLQLPGFRVLRLARQRSEMVWTSFSPEAGAEAVHLAPSSLSPRLAGALASMSGRALALWGSV